MSIVEKILKNSSEFNSEDILVGIFRSILALSSLILFLNPDGILFHTGSGVESVPFCSDTFLSSINVFCIFKSNLIIAKSIVILILVSVIAGIYPRYTCILHWWVTFCINYSIIIVDGGSQVATALTTLLVPILIFDKRKNHWNSTKFQSNERARITSYIFYNLIKFQISIIYFDAAISKFSNESWSNGTALYYFLNDTLVGAAGFRKQLVNFLFDSPILLVASTYFVLILEIIISLSLLIDDKESKKYILYLGILFHTLIFVFIGIFSFAIVMIASLLFLLIPLRKIELHPYEKDYL